MHHFESSAEMMPAQSDRRDRQSMLAGVNGNGAAPDTAAPQPAIPAAPASHGPAESVDSAQGQAQGPAQGSADHRQVPSARPQSDAERAMVPSANGESAPGAGRHLRAVDRDDRPYRKVADGLAITARVSVVLPVMNEAANLPAVFATIPVWVDEIVLVDGRSTDDTVEVARRLRPDVKVVLQGGVGKGDALVAGFTVSSGDIIVAIDGDGSTDGDEIVRFVGALLGGADFAKGSRFASSGNSDDITPIRRLGNKVLNLTVNRLFRTQFTDLCYGYNAFWSHSIGELELDSPGFEVEALMSIRAAEAGLRIHEVPSHERLRQHGTSNLSAVKDGWRILKLISREKWSSGRRKASKARPFMAPGHLALDDGSVQPLPARGRNVRNAALDGEHRGWARADAERGIASTGVTHGSVGQVRR